MNQTSNTGTLTISLPVNVVTTGESLSLVLDVVVDNTATNVTLGSTCNVHVS